MSEPINERFGEDYFREKYGVTDCKPFSQHWWAVRLYSGVSHRLLRRIGGRRMLEIGCGYGFILGKLEDRYETFGIDISSHAIEQCRRYAPKSHCAVADIEQGLPAHLERESFDLVLACYVFEHIHEPGTTIAELATLLRPGGRLLFSVPNTESLGARWKGKNWYAYGDSTHCSLLPPDTWLKFTRDAELTVQREFSDGYWDVPYVPWLPNWLQFPFFIAPSALTCLLARAILPARFGENVIVIAQKPNRPQTA